jgi:hypothetical protein
MFIDNLPPTDNLWHLTMDSELNMVCDYLVDTIYKATKQASITPNTPTCRYPQEANKNGKTFFTTKMTSKYGNPLTGRAVSTPQTPIGKNQAIPNFAPILKLS